MRGSGLTPWDEMFTTLRGLVLGLALPARELSCKGASFNHPPCGGPPPSSRLTSPIMVETLQTDAQQLVAQQLVDGMRVALDDRRRVDEIVTTFEYSGSVHVPAEGQDFVGQGAVKRFLTTLLVDNAVQRVQLDDSGTVVVSLNDDQGKPRELHLTPTSRGSVVAGITQISQLKVHEPAMSESSAPTLTPIFSSAPATLDGALDGGPKWETFDGRVRQRIWQQYDLFSPGNPFLKDTMELSTGRLILMVDETVWGLYGEKISTWADSVDLELETIIAAANEDHKTLETFAYMLDELKRADPLRRSEPVLAVGGGVLTDTAGFACACWRRGIPWCRLPTTLLGVVDASVGIKVAINYHRKNGVGHFFSPIHTFIDTAFLGTVPLADIRSGCGEIMKAALIHDVRLYELMEAHGPHLIKERFQTGLEAAQIIKLSIDAMLECIGPDLWEEALLRPMDFGHTFSRTLEADESFILRHGEAVAIDCIMSSLIAEQKGLLPTEQADKLLDLYAALGLPCSIKGITAETYKRARDEIVVHRDGLLRAPLPKGIGNCAYVDDMSDEEIDKAFARLEVFMDAHPETSWDPSKSFAAAKE